MQIRKPIWWASHLSDDKGNFDCNCFGKALTEPSITSSRNQNALPTKLLNSLKSFKQIKFNQGFDWGRIISRFC